MRTKLGPWPLAGFAALVVAFAACTSSNGGPKLPPEMGGTGGLDGGEDASGGTANLGGEAGEAGAAGAAGEGCEESAGVSGAPGQNEGGAGGAGGAGGDSNGAAGAAGAGGGDDSGAPSCEGLALCHDESCCTSLPVTGCTECTPFGCKAKATVSTFRLDKYEVTVGRFRNFVLNYGGPPMPAQGEHPGVSASGWQSAWDDLMPLDDLELTDDEHLQACPGSGSWTDEVLVSEQKPINCVSWYEAFAFCIWDGGFLPTEVEWQYAAAGGMEKRAYPWGDDEPTAARAIYGACGSGLVDTCTLMDVAEVGSKSSGSGFWGHQDLAGSMWEWTFDYFSSLYLQGPCVDCANRDSSQYRVRRGGAWNNDPSFLTTTGRYTSAPETRSGNLGFRCARPL